MHLEAAAVGQDEGEGGGRRFVAAETHPIRVNELNPNCRRQTVERQDRVEGVRRLNGSEIECVEG